MERLKHFLSCCLLLVSMQTFATDDSLLHLQLIKKIPGSYINFNKDNLGSYYVQNSPNQIIKLSTNGDSIASFNDVKRYGNIYSFDVTNPLKIVVYYKDFATIVVADRFLSKINTIDLRKANIYQAKAVALSYDNNFWVYDELDGKLKKVDDNGNIIFASTDFRLLFSEAPDISCIIDNNKQLYLYDAKTGWYIFDYYGALKTKVPFLNWQDVSVNDNILSGRDSSILYSYDPKLLQLNSWKVTIPQAIKIIKENDLLYALTKEGLLIYKVIDSNSSP